MTTIEAADRLTAVIHQLRKHARLVTRQLRERTRYLRSLVVTVDQFLTWMDVEMKKPTSLERGKRIAQAMNSLDLANQSVKRFALRRQPKILTARKK